MILERGAGLGGGGIEGGDEDVAGADSFRGGEGVLMILEVILNFFFGYFDELVSAEGYVFFLLDAGCEEIAEGSFVVQAVGLHCGLEFSFALEAGGEVLEAVLDFSGRDGEFESVVGDFDAEELVIDEIAEGGVGGEFFFGRS